MTDLVRSGVFVTNLDGSLVLATSGIISSEFDNLADSGWLVTSYTLAICAVQPIVSPYTRVPFDISRGPLTQQVW